MEPKGPVLGDIIVHKRHASGDVYVLMPFERASQLTCQSYAEALKHATDFAVKGAVNAWYTEDGQTYRSLAVHRRGRQLGSSKHQR
jgi:hypothetical protein